jgi:hypothetical protein
MIESPTEPAVLNPPGESVAFPTLRRWELPVRWLFAHPALLIAGLANLLFVFLPFYDANNIPLALSAGSHFTSAYAPASYNHWVAGPFIYSVYVPMHFAYLASDFQLYAAYTVLKAIYFGLTVWLAYALYRVFRLRGESLALAVAAFVLANPLLFYVSYIWTEYDILPIAFVTVGYLLLRYSGLELSDRTRILSAVALIAVSVFFYWFALVLVPTLLYYARTRRELLLELGAFAAILGGLFAATLYAFGDTLGLFTGALAGSNSALNRADSFGFQFFLQLPGPAYLLLVGLLAVVLPLVLRELRFTEPATLFVVVTLFVFTSAVPMPDNYVFVFPFALLSFLLWSPAQTRFRWLWGLLGYPLVGLFLINFLISNAQPDGVGVLMFGYALFHTNFQFLYGTAQDTAFLWAFNGLVVAAILLSFALLYSRSRTEPARPFFPPPDLAPPAAPTSASRRLGRRAALWGGGALAALVVLSLAFNAATPNLVNYHGSSPPPVYEMLPNYDPQNGNVVRELPGATYSVSGNSITIGPAAPPLAFDRWFAGNSVSLAGTIGLAGITPRSTLVIDGLPYRLWLDNDSAPDLSGASKITPQTVTGVHAGSNVSLPSNESAPAQYYNSNAYSQYSFAPGTFVNRYYLFSFSPVSRPAGTSSATSSLGDGAVSALGSSGPQCLHSPGAASGPQTALFFIDGAHEYLNLVYNSNETTVVYSGWLTDNATCSIVLGGIVPLDQWSYAIIHPTANGTDVNINGLDNRVELPMFTTGPTSLYVGTPVYNNSQNNSFHGFATGLYATNSTPTIAPVYGFTLQDGDQFTNRSLSTPSVSFRIDSTAAGTSYTVDGLTLHSASPTTAVAFGKFASAPYALTFSVSQFTVSQYAPDRYYLVPVFWAAVGPFLLIGVTLPFLRRGIGHPSARPRTGSAPPRAVPPPR